MRFDNFFEIGILKNFLYVRDIKKTKPQIFQSMNLKHWKKASEPLYNGVLFLIHYFKKQLKTFHLKGFFFDVTNKLKNKINISALLQDKRDLARFDSWRYS